MLYSGRAEGTKILPLAEQEQLGLSPAAAPVGAANSVLTPEKHQTSNTKESVL